MSGFRGTVARLMLLWGLLACGVWLSDRCLTELELLLGVITFR